MNIDRPEFTMSLPDASWIDCSKPESYEFQKANDEQIIVVVHNLKKALNWDDLENAVRELARMRLSALQDVSGKSCHFEPPVVKMKPGRLDVVILGHDLRQNIFIAFALLGTPTTILAVSYYDYTPSGGMDDFRQQAEVLLSSVVVK